MASFDECCDRLPTNLRHWVVQVMEEAGTTDGDWDIFEGAARLLDNLATGKDFGVELVPTDDLIAELLKRFDFALFAAYMVPGPKRNRILRRWKGNSITVAGLATDCGRTVLEELDRESTEAKS